MMKHGVLLILVVMVVSCATPSYMHLYESPKSLDFTTGKWLDERGNSVTSHVQGRVDT